MNFNDDNTQGFKKSKITKVRNKSAAPVQITAEQLLREAKERELEATPRPPQQKLTTETEKREYQLQKRQDYENNIRKDRMKIITWMNYANFETSQNEIGRARNVFERAIAIHFRTITLWLKYAEMEIQSKQVQHARNLFDRALNILPRANQIWFKYVYMEQKLQNIEAARRIFKRWMRWCPPPDAWFSFINMEKKFDEIDNVHNIYKMLVHEHNEESHWIKWAKFEESFQRLEMARNVYTSAIHSFGSDNPPATVLKEFARFEERRGEHERVKAIYKYALDNLPKTLSEDIYKAFLEYEKKFGTQLTIQESIVVKRTHHYEGKVSENPHDYDEWFSYLNMLQEENQSAESVREVFERAIANKPLVEAKRFWRRYIYLWIRYAMFEELDCGDRDRAVEVLAACLNHIPHDKFSFSKVWIMKAELHIRQRDLSSARKTLGNALGRCPTSKLYRFFIDLETELLEFDRVRKHYRNFILFRTFNQQAWTEFADFEVRQRQFHRVREILETALKHEVEKPYFIWKKYIDFEASLGEFDNCWKLHRRILELEEHALIWCSFANLQMLDFDESDIDSIYPTIERARAVFEEANQSLKKADDGQRRLLLNSWKKFEEDYGTDESVEHVTKKFPTQVMQKRRVDNGDGSSSWMETTVSEFPDDMEVDDTRADINDFLLGAECWGLDD